MMRNSKRFTGIAAAGVIVIVAAGVGGAVSTSLWADAAAVTASSSALGTNPNDLRASGGSPPYVASGSDATPADDDDRTSRWSSQVGDDGVTLTTTWADPTTVSRIRITGVADPREGFESALLRFSDGSNLHLQTDHLGDLDVAFAPRDVTSATLFVSERENPEVPVSLALLHIDGSGPEVSGEAPERTAASSSAAAGSTADAGGDGAPDGSSAGRSWTPSQSDNDPWVELRWSAPVPLASAQILGSGDAADADLWGDLVFSDGSRIRVSGVEAGGEPTTIGFAPRMATWMRFEPSPPPNDGTIVIGELHAYPVGETPQRSAAQDEGGATVSPTPPVRCSTDSSPIGSASTSGIALVCPATGTSVTDSATIVVSAPPNISLDVEAWIPARTGDGGALGIVASGAVDADGLASFSFDVSRLPHGPFAVRVSAPDMPPKDQLYIQLFNKTGIDPEDGGTAPAGMTLQWAEEFTDPLSISATGVGETYAALKPTARGGENFGFAVFADPAWGENTVATLADDYLRIRVQPIEDYSAWWGQEHLGGLISSAHTGGAGFAAQYGSFEARMLGAAGSGTWPAFWTLTSESATERGATTSDEVDIVEQYGHNPVGSCHTLHDWFEGDDRSGRGTCLAVNGATNWALAWHTYSALITPGQAIFYIDGVEVARKVGLSASDEPYFFLVDLALGGGWPIDLTPTGDVADLYVDWVRVYT